MNSSMVSKLSKPKYAIEYSDDAPKMAKFLIGKDPKLSPEFDEPNPEFIPDDKLCVHAVSATADGA